MDQDKVLPQLSAMDIMTREVVTVTEEMPVKDLVNLLQERHLIRAAVVKGKTLAGIVVRKDAVFGHVRTTPYYWP